ncbi:MAG: class I SAM-dependent methyltransferase [Chloroflexi bacterium]|nr:class I SAM-dependent methyltransferase [Chloroflexota bacterium]
MSSGDQKSPNDLSGDDAAKAEATGWFEGIYSRANKKGKGVPWAKMTANAHLVNWLTEENINGAGQRALVVGCGLGDDAEELARRGYDVTAFDIAASAIALCQQRFPGSPVKYQTADLFAAPREWQRAFDFVFENITVQALPPELQDQAIKHISPLTAPGGRLLVVTSARQPDEIPSGPPWPLARTSLDRYLDDGMIEIFQKAETLQAQPVIWHVHALYERSE